MPLARSIQSLVSNTVGREFFTYLVLSTVGLGSAALLYNFVYTLTIRKISQYVWIFICAGLYVYFTLHLKANPEESVHFVEYGILSYFIFTALSHKVRDSTIYIITPLLVLFIGTADEFIQWMIPQRIWDYRDIGLNLLASVFLMIVIWKGIKPKIISGPVKKTSVQVLVGIITIELIISGLCLSNTPGNVSYYTQIFNKTAWLQNEEPMTDFGYKHIDPEIGTFYSRFTLQELREIDYNRGSSYKGTLPVDISSRKLRKELLKKYNPTTDPFLYELLRHIMRRNILNEQLLKTGIPDKKIQISSVVYKENLLVEKYFAQTLKQFGYKWPEEKTEGLKRTAAQWQGDYISKIGTLTTSFNLKTAWIVIVIALLILWTSVFLWMKRLEFRCQAVNTPGD